MELVLFSRRLFSLEPSQSEGRVYKSKICLSVCLRFQIKALYIIPGSHLTSHIIYCWVGDDVTCHMAMSMTHTETNTQIKTNPKCFKDRMYVIFLKSREFKDFKYDMDMDNGGVTNRWK